LRPFSIRARMALILGSAVGLAALRNANEVWARVTTTIALALFCAAVLWTIFLRGHWRAWWLGFAVFSGAYLFVSFSPLRDGLGARRVLQYIHEKIAGSAIATFEISRSGPSSILCRVVTSNGDVRVRTVPENVFNSARSQDILFSIAPPSRWQSTLPGVANADAFQRVGDSLFALLSGLVGGMIAVRCWRGRDAIGVGSESRG
jgi:hypothetical protein